MQYAKGTIELDHFQVFGMHMGIYVSILGIDLSTDLDYRYSIGTQIYS